MTKKSKRQARKASPTPAQKAPAPTPESAARSPIQDFNPDYTHIIRDLKRIGILAGSFILLLVVLSFVLR